MAYTKSISPLRLLAALPTAVLPAQGITPIQVMRLQSVSEVFDAGEHGVLFTRLIPRLADGGVGPIQRHLFLLSDDGTEKRILTEGGSFAVWGDKVTYTGGTDQSQKTEVLAKSLVDGKIQRVTMTPNGVRTYKWSPDFRYIAYTQQDSVPEPRKTAVEFGFRQKIVDEDYRDIGLWLWDRTNGSVRRLTEKGSVFDYVWSNDSTRLALALAPRNLVDDSYMFKRLHVVDLRGHVEKLLDNPGKLGDIAWSPDGKQIAYISAADSRDPHAGMLYLADVATGDSRPLTDGFLGMVNHISWRSGTSIQALISKGVHTHIATIDALGGEMKFHFGGQSRAYSQFVWKDRQILAVASSASHPGEVFAITKKSSGDVSAQRRTDSNPWLKDVPLGKQEVVQFKARDGLSVEGLLLYPVGFTTGKRYPLVVVVHGGPESHFDNGWNTSYSGWGQLLCARGYFAWYPNYRSSTGYGVAFTKHDHGDVMGGEFNDHIDAIAHFDKLGLIDTARVGIGGGSYGGYTSAWAATKGTKHFAAAVSFVPFVDIRTKWYTSDIPWEFYYVHYEEKHAHEQVGYLHDRSPLTWAAQCRTPLLLLGGTADPRVHPSQPHMLYRAVQFSTDTPVRYVQYPGEGHGNRTNTNQFDYMIRSLRWFDHYLKAGNHRSDPPPPMDLDYTEWYRTR